MLPAKTQDTNMKAKNFENGLAVVGALIVIVGVSAAASSALAEDNGGGPRALPEPLTVQDVIVAEATLSDAEAANYEAASEALATLNEATSADLDIQLADHSSLLLASRD